MSLIAMCCIGAISASADQSSLIYTGATQLVHGRPTLLKTALVDTTTGQAIAGATVQFALGPSATTALVENDGSASTPLTVDAAAGSSSLTITYAGDVVHSAVSLNVPVTIAPQPSAIILASAPYWATGEDNMLSAMLVDADFGSPIVSKSISFALPGSSASALSNGSGIASAIVALPIITVTGPADLSVTFAGDADVRPSSVVQSGDVFQATSFVIWGGNPGGLRIGQTVVFSANDWSKQVLAGDYNGGNFNGYAPVANSQLGTCPTDLCWADPPGNLRSPEPAIFLSVFVSTRIDRVRNTVVGNTDRIAVLAADPVLNLNGRAPRRTGRVLFFLPGPDHTE